LYLYIYIELLAVHTNKKRLSSAIPVLCEANLRLLICIC